MVVAMMRVLMLMMMGHLVACNLQPDSRDTYEVTDSRLGGEGGSSGDLSAASVLDWQPKTHAEYITAIRRLRAESQQAAQANKELMSYLKGKGLAMGCALALPIKQLQIKLTGQTESGSSLDDSAAQTTVDQNHRLLVYLGSGAEMVVAAGGYQLFSGAFMQEFTGSQQIGDITHMMIKQEGEAYFGGEPYTITALEVRVGRPLRPLLKLENMNYELSQQARQVMMASDLMMTWNPAYQQLLAQHDCGGS